LLGGQEAASANLPVTAGGRKGKDQWLADTRGTHPYTGARTSELLREGVPTSRGALMGKMTPKQAKAMQEANPDVLLTKAAVEAFNPKGIGPVEGTGGYTARALRRFTGVPDVVSENLGASPDVRKAIAGLEDTGRADLAKTRAFFSEADWPKAVKLMKKGMTPAAALAALGYSITGMAAEEQ
jgi:hypothetical protein